MKSKTFVLFAKTVDIPEEIEIDGKKVKIKDSKVLTDLLEQVRKQEKNKLYSNISTLEAEIKVLEKNAALTDAEKEELKTAKEDLVTLKNDKKILDEKLKELEESRKKTKDVDEEEQEKGKKAKGLSAEDVKALIQESLKESMAGITKTIQDSVGEVKGDLTKKKTNDYRKELLEKHGSVLIPDLLKGDSPEELDKNLVKALETSKQYITVEHEGKKVTLAEREKLIADEVEKAKKSKEDEEEEESKKNKNRFNKPDTGKNAFADKDLIEHVGEMTDEEYAKNREAILREVKQLKYQEESE